jgi:hypothetical protein
VGGFEDRDLLRFGLVGELGVGVFVGRGSGIFLLRLRGRLVVCAREGNETGSSTRPRHWQGCDRGSSTTYLVQRFRYSTSGTVHSLSVDVNIRDRCYNVIMPMLQMLSIGFNFASLQL